MVPQPDRLLRALHFHSSPGPRKPLGAAPKNQQLQLIADETPPAALEKRR